MAGWPWAVARPGPPGQQELRQGVWNEAVKDVAKVSHERAVIRRLEKLLVA